MAIVPVPPVSGRLYASRICAGFNPVGLGVDKGTLEEDLFEAEYTWNHVLADQLFAIGVDAAMIDSGLGTTRTIATRKTPMIAAGLFVQSDNRFNSRRFFDSSIKSPAILKAFCLNRALLA